MLMPNQMDDDRYTSYQHQDRDVLVLGIGNTLMGDDGVGIRVVEILANEELPANVVVKAAGLPGWGLPSWLEGKDNVILVDAMQMGQAPGSWRRFSGEEIQLVETKALSLHQHGLDCGLALTQALGILPGNLLLYGFEPADLSAGAILSPEVRASIPEVIDQILLDIEKIVK
jgi:hydrogenase maturation protease